MGAPAPVVFDKWVAGLREGLVQRLVTEQKGANHEYLDRFTFAALVASRL